MTAIVNYFENIAHDVGHLFKDGPACEAVANERIVSLFFRVMGGLLATVSAIVVIEALVAFSVSPASCILNIAIGIILGVAAYDFLKMGNNLRIIVKLVDMVAAGVVPDMAEGLAVGAELVDARAYQARTELHYMYRDTLVAEPLARLFNSCMGDPGCISPERERPEPAPVRQPSYMPRPSFDAAW